MNINININGNAGHFIRALLVGLASALLVLPVWAQTVPVSGRPVPSLSDIDDIVVDYMNDNMDEGGYEAVIVGIQRNDDIVYLKGFGWLYPNVAPMPENAMVRLASVTKVVTAAAIRHLADTNAGLDLSDNAFALGQAGGGVLNVNPFGGKGDNRLDDITVLNLIQHQGGWDRNAQGVTDLTYEECTIADAYNIDSPPGRTRTMDWILGQPLEFDPGSQTRYSNIGYLASGMIVEQISGQGLMSYVHDNILTENMWIPWHEIRLGRTFRDDQLPREPWYRAGNWDNVFDNCDTNVSAPYGGWHHEARIGQGGMVASAAAMLELANRYRVRVGNAIGTPLADLGTITNSLHGGSLPGTNTRLYQRSDGINMFVFLNTRRRGASAEDLRVLVRDYINDGINNNTITWPDTTSDGFWVVPCSSDCYSVYDQGGYHAPIRSIDLAEDFLGAGSKVRLKPGTYSLSDGVLDEKMRIDAPLGTAVIGR